MRKSRILYVVLVPVILTAAGGYYLYREATAPVGAVVDANRDPNWAAPMAMEGVPNFYKVSEDLYRGGQPSSEGMKNMQDFGIKTIVSLRAFHSDKDEIRDTNLAYVHIYVHPLNLNEDEIVEFLKAVTDRSRVPVFVHCQFGADRTGMMCAVYRIALQNWDKEKAIEEMTKGDYGFHGIWKNIIEYIRKLDMDAIKRKAGIVGQQDDL